MSININSLMVEVRAEQQAEIASDVKHGGATLEERITFNDPETFSRSWETVVTYKKLAGARIAEDVCLERRNITLKAPGVR